MLPTARDSLPSESMLGDEEDSGGCNTTARSSILGPEVELSKKEFDVASLAVGILALIVWLSNLFHYFPFFADDGFISLRYSQRLLAGDGLTWTDGERVEGYSNLAYVLLCAAFGSILDLVDAARLVGILGGFMLAFAVYRAGRLVDVRAKLAAPLVCLVLASMGSLAIWSIGGLEASLLIGLVALGYVQWFEIAPQAVQRPWYASVKTWPLALACWTRPDAPLFVAWLALCELIRGKFTRSAWKRALLTATLPALAYLSQLFFRVVYYQDVVPNTARIKAEPGLARLNDGVNYLLAAFDGAWLVVGLAGVAVYSAVFAGHRRIEVLVFGGAAVLWLMYVLSIGGDIFPGWRHALPAYGLFTIAGLWGLEWLIQFGNGQVPSGSKWRGGFLLLILAAVGSLFGAQRDDPGNRRAESERWEWAAEPVGQLYRHFARHDPLMAVEPAGALPYYSQLRALDMFGLCDRHIAMQSAQASRALAHDHGDGDYVWKKKPDLMVLSMPWGGGAYSTSGQEMLAKPTYHLEYQRVSFLAADPFDVVAQAEVRIRGKLGITQSNDRIEIPGYLFAGATVVGHLTVTGEVGALVEGVNGGTSPVIQIPAGTWRIRAKGASSWLRVFVKNQGKVNIDTDYTSQSITVSTSTPIVARVASHDDVQTEFISLEFYRSTDVPGQVETLEVGREWALAKVSEHGESKFELQPSDALVTPMTGFIDMKNGKMLAKASLRKECTKKLSLIDLSMRLDTYATEERDKWMGEASGPAFVVPSRGVAMVCLSGARHSAGIRLRLTDTQEIVRTWMGSDSAAPRTIVSDISSYAGRPARFEAYDRRNDGWGHVRLYGLGIGLATGATVDGNK